MKRPMTPAGYAALRTELLKLKSSRAEIAHAIEVARGHGDLSENGDYDAAKEKSGMVEAKIRDLENKLAEADVIDLSKIVDPQKVVFGTTVQLEDLDSGEERTYTIVGSDESDIKRGKISFDSPIGKALIGKVVGDTAKVQAPGGVREYEVCEIRIELETGEVAEMPAE